LDPPLINYKRNTEIVHTQQQAEAGGNISSFITPMATVGSQWVTVTETDKA